MPEHQFCCFCFEEPAFRLLHLEFLRLESFPFVWQHTEGLCEQSAAVMERVLDYCLEVMDRLGVYPEGHS
jgi:hypothetical protein